MKLSDFRGVFTKSTATILSVDNMHGDYYQIRLKPEERISWIPGDHAIFTLPFNKVKGKKFRAFSIASTKEEGVILLGTRVGKEISSFKKELISMNIGDKVSVRGPFGWFKVQNPSSPIILIAGGVGITPIRALLKQLEDSETRPIELLYASSEFYLFYDEIQKFAENNEKITIHKTKEISETAAMIDELVKKYKGEAYYYISGSVPFVKGIKKQIKNLSVSSSRIINDSFYGY